MWFDILTLVVIGYSTIRGAKKGIVWQLAIIGALIACFAFSEPLSLLLAPTLPVDPPLNRWLAMLGIYLGFAFASFAVARTLRSWIEAWKFVEYDRHVGAIFGFIKGGVFCLVLTFFVVMLSDQLRLEILNSHSGYAAAIIMDRLHPVMPAELHDVLEPYIHQLDRPDMDLKHTHGERTDQDYHSELHSESAHEMRPGIEDATSHHETPEERSIQDMISSIPQAFGEGLRKLIQQAFENTAPEDRPELLERLRPATPDLLRLVARKWQNGKPK